MIDWFASLPAHLLAMASSALDHPIAWVALGIAPVAAIVLGGMEIHLRRVNHRARKSAARRYNSQETR